MRVAADLLPFLLPKIYQHRVLEASWGRLRASWARLRVSWGRLRARLEALWERLGSALVSWGILGGPINGY